MKLLLNVLLTFVLSSIIHANSIEGEWVKSDGSGRVIFSITKKGELIGKISWVKDIARTHDTHNPDTKLRKRRLLGLPVAEGFTKNSKNDVWKGGTIYDSQTGKTYKGKIWLENSDNLRMRGFLGVSLIGRTADFKRYR